VEGNVCVVIATVMKKTFRRIGSDSAFSFPHSFPNQWRKEERVRGEGGEGEVEEEEAAPEEEGAAGVADGVVADGVVAEGVVGGVVLVGGVLVGGVGAALVEVVLEGEEVVGVEEGGREEEVITLLLLKNMKHSDATSLSNDGSVVSLEMKDKSEKREEVYEKTDGEKKANKRT
jgi:hypothetical protein